MWYNQNTNEAQSNSPWWPSTYVSPVIRKQYLDAGWRQEPDNFVLPVTEQPQEPSQ